MNDNYLKRSLKLVRLNLWTLVKFELIYKLIAALIFAPLVIGFINLAMRLSGIRYVTLENVWSFVLHPVTLIFGVILFIIATFAALFDIGALLVIFDESYHDDVITLPKLVYYNFRQCSKLFRPKNFLVALILLLLAPFLNIGFGSNVLTSLSAPTFIADYVAENSVLLFVVVLIYVLALLGFANWIYILHYMVLEKKSFHQARLASRNLAKGHRLGDMLRILVAQFVGLGIFKLVIFLGVIGVQLLLDAFSGAKILESLMISFLSMVIVFAIVVNLAFSGVINYAVMSALFYRHKEKSKEKIHEVVLGDNYPKKSRRNYKIWIISAASLAFIGGVVWSYWSVSGEANVKAELFRETEITAHRGSGVNYPENTMLAFQGAVDEGADWIELDVQQTRDGMVVVSHDASLKRTAGIKRNIYEMDYEELEDIDVGSYLSDEFSNARIPTLAEVLIFADENNIRLNIEIKPNDNYVDIEEGVLALVDEYYRKDMCVISSLHYGTLQRVKELDPEMHTLYTLALAAGRIESLEYADAVSVEVSSVSSRMVRRVHNAGKEIYAWTANTEDDILDMVELGVDNIITDDVTKARGLILRKRSGNSVESFLRLIEDFVGN